MSSRTGICRPRPLATLATGLAAALTVSCDGGTEPSSFEPGPLGAVTLREGEAVRIRSLLSMSVALSLGAPARHAVELAVRDVGTVADRDIDLGDALDSMCTPEGGRAAARQVVADPQVVGAIGTSCSAAAVAASPVISEAGYLMIAPSTTSPRLTSDLAGNANPDYYPGYFRNQSAAGRTRTPQRSAGLPRGSKGRSPSPAPAGREAWPQRVGWLPCAEPSRPPTRGALGRQNLHTRTLRSPPYAVSTTEKEKLSQEVPPSARAGPSSTSGSSRPPGVQVFLAGSTTIRPHPRLTR